TLRALAMSSPSLTALALLCLLSRTLLPCSSIYTLSLHDALPIFLLGTFAITGEYSTGSVMTTLQSVPRRSRLLLAKALVQFGTGCALGLMFGVLGTPVAAVFSAEFGAFESSDMVRAALGTGIGLGLLNVFVLGLGTVLRSAVMTIITTLALLQLVPSLLPLFGVTLMSELARFLPNQAIAVLSVDAPGPYGWPIALLV